MNERDYERGFNAAWDSILSEALHHLPRGRATKHEWRRERNRAVAMLREVCERHGDNDWHDTMDLGEVIEKHLLRKLETP